MTRETSSSPRRGEGRFEATLRDSLAARCSADDLYRGVPVKALRRLTPPVRHKRQLRADIFTIRLPRLLADAVDHGRRRTFVFVREPGDERRYPDLRALAPEEKRAVAERRPGGGSRVSPDEPDGDTVELTTGQCVARLAEDIAAGGVSDRSMEWLFTQQDYSLDWLYFGVGPMYRGQYHDVDTPWTDETRITKEEDRFPSFAALNQLRHNTVWTLMEWNWLINNVARSNYHSRQPIQSLCVRMVAGWNIEPCQPALPDPPRFVRWMRRWLVREFILGQRAEVPWKQSVIEECCAARDKIYLLFGITKVAASAYRRGITSPSAGITRVCYFLNMIIRRMGRDGFLRYLDIADDEARGRRFTGLCDVFAQGTWVYHDKDFRSRRGRPRKERPQGAMDGPEEESALLDAESGGGGESR